MHWMHLQEPIFWKQQDELAVYAFPHSSQHSPQFSCRRKASPPVLAHDEDYARYEHAVLLTVAQCTSSVSSSKHLYASHQARMLLILPLGKLNTHSDST